MHGKTCFRCKHMRYFTLTQEACLHWEHEYIPLTLFIMHKQFVTICINPFEKGSNWFHCASKNDSQAEISPVNPLYTNLCNTYVSTLLRSLHRYNFLLKLKDCFKKLNTIPLVYFCLSLSIRTGMTDQSCQNKVHWQMKLFQQNFLNHLLHFK